MPIPLFVVGAKCRYTFSAQNLPPGLSIRDNLISGKISEAGTWEVILTAFPSNLKYPVLQKTFTVTVGEKITREVITDLVTYQELTANASNLSTVDIASINNIESRISVFPEIYLDILSRATLNAEINTQKVSDINGVLNAAIILDNCPVIFYELNRTSRGNVDLLPEIAPKFVQNSFSYGSQVIYFNLGDVFSAQFANRSQTTYFGLGDISTGKLVNQSQTTVSTSIKEVISTLFTNKSETLPSKELSLISTKFVNQSHVNALTDSRPKLELIQSNVRNLSQANINR